MTFKLIALVALIIGMYGSSSAMEGTDSKNKYSSLLKKYYAKVECHRICNTLCYIAEDDVDEVKKMFTTEPFWTPQDSHNNTTFQAHAEKFNALKVLAFFEQRQALIVYESYKNAHEYIIEIRPNALLKSLYQLRMEFGDPIEEWYKQEMKE